MALLNAPHVLPLRSFVERIRLQTAQHEEVPDFDPCDGGIMATALFLLDAPGPKAIQSGFVSRNNPDPTAKNLCELLSDAEIDRTASLIWNVVPWYLGSGKKIRSTKKADHQAALPYMSRLLVLLPKIMVIVLFGGKSQRVYADLSKLTNVPILKSYHPGAQSLNRLRTRRNDVLSVLREAKTLMK